MASYNLIGENWIKVKYLDGTVREIGIRQCLEDAENIDDIIPPTFRRDTATIYYVPLLRLLTTIVMSAYFKPEQNFASSNFKYLKKFQDTIYTDVIKDYLDKWYDRFDILSKEHPFLQNKDILGKVETDDKDLDSCFLLSNPLAPASNNIMFGKNRSQNTTSLSNKSQYKMSLRELSYFLLYQATMGLCPCPAQYDEGSLEKISSIYVVLKSKNLKETILKNVIILSGDKDDIIYDKPIWELDSIQDIERYYPLENRYKNYLMCSFYPAISLYVETLQNTNDIRIIRCRKYLAGITLNPKDTQKMQNNYFYPSATVTINSKSKTTDYATYRYDMTSYLMCVKATKKFPDKDTLMCELLSYTQFNNSLLDNCCIKLFVRDVGNGNQRGTNFISCQEIDGGNPLAWKLICDNRNNQVSEDYQRVFNDMKMYFCKFINSIHTQRRLPNGKKVDCKKSINELSKLTAFVETDFFTEFTDDLKNSVETPIYNFIERAYKFMLDRINRNISYSNSMIDTVNALNTFNSKIASLKKKEEGH